MRVGCVLTATLVLLVTLGCSGTSETGTSAGDVADTVCTHGKICTVDEAQPQATEQTRSVVRASALT